MPSVVLSAINLCFGFSSGSLDFNTDFYFQKSIKNKIHKNVPCDIELVGIEVNHTQSSKMEFCTASK